MTSLEFAARAAAPPYTAQIIPSAKLSDRDILHFLALQAYAFVSARAGTEHFLKEKNAAHLRSNVWMVSLKNAQGVHIGQCLLTDASNPKAAHMGGYPVPGETRRLVIQSVLTDHKHRYSCDTDMVRNGMDPVSVMFRAIKQFAADHGFTEIMAKTDVANKSSLKAFGRNGFAVHSTKQCPGESYTACFLQFSLEEEAPAMRQMAAALPGPAPEPAH